jgi:hypothetical protein
MRLVVFLFAASVLTSNAQQIMTGINGGPILQNDDMAALESGDPRKDLECTVTPEKALLGFDLRFHSGYLVSLPLKELEGSGDNLTILFRVTRKPVARLFTFPNNTGCLRSKRHRELQT